MDSRASCTLIFYEVLGHPLVQPRKIIRLVVFTRNTFAEFHGRSKDARHKLARRVLRNLNAVTAAHLARGRAETGFFGHLSVEAIRSVLHDPVLKELG